MSPAAPSSAGSPGQPWSSRRGSRWAIRDGPWPIADEDRASAILRSSPATRPGTPRPTWPTCSRRTGGPIAAFTGGSMLLGSVGRTDLSGPWVTDRLSHLQHRSARRLSDELPDDAAILPTHGFGSLCSAGFPVGGARHRETPATSVPRTPRCSWTRTRSSPGWSPVMDAFPRYYAYIAPRNREGAGRGRLELPPLSDARGAAARASTRRGVGGRPARASRVCRPPSHRHARIRALRSLDHLPGLAAPVGEPAQPDRRSLDGPRGRPPGAGANRHRDDRCLRRQSTARMGEIRGPVSRRGSYPVVGFARPEAVHRRSRRGRGRRASRP